jgi:MYXO-CTERM domain-containing protein
MRRRGSLAALAALAVLGSWQGRGQAAVVIDTFLQESVRDQATLASPNLTIGTAPKRLLVVSLALADPTVEIGKVSWNGTPLVRAAGQMQAGPNGFCRLELWTLLEPASGPHRLDVSLSAPAAFGLGAVSYSGVDPKEPFGASAWKIGDGGPVAVNVYAPGDRPVLAAACLGGPWATGPTASTPAAVVADKEIELWNFTEPGVVGLGSHRVASNGLGEARWTIGGVDPYSWLAMAVSIKPDGELLPDAGPDAAGGDALPDAAGGDALAVPDAPDDAGVSDGTPAPDRTAPSDLARAPDDASDELPDGASNVDVHLRVGCACRTGGPGGGAGVMVMALALLALGRRRGRRP